MELLKIPETRRVTATDRLNHPTKELSGWRRAVFSHQLRHLSPCLFSPLLPYVACMHISGRLALVALVVGL